MACAVGAAVALFLAAVLALAAPEPASAQAAPPQITGRYVVDRSTAVDSSPVKQLVAQCDPGDQVLGGGGGAFAVAPGDPIAGAEINRHLEMIQSMPFGGTSPQINAQGFIVTAAETGGGTLGNWYVSVRAVCATNLVAGHQIVTSSTGFSSASSQSAQADCPGGKSAVGTGAQINFTPGQGAIGVGLQVSRTRGAGESTLAIAHEQASGYAFNWQLVDYAVCVTTPLGYEIRANDTSGQGSIASCTGTKQILDAGGVSDATYSEAIPFDTVDDAYVVATRNQPTSFISAYAICATTTQR